MKLSERKPCCMEDLCQDCLWEIKLLEIQVDELKHLLQNSKEVQK